MKDEKTDFEGLEADEGNATAQRRICVLVLGAHRSGTSALTKVLSLAGAALPATLLGGGTGNRAGHWEPLPLVRYHDEFLDKLGSSWDDWRPIEVTRLSPEHRTEYKADIARLLHEQYGEAPLIVLKEPRACKLAALLIEAVDQAHFDIRTVIPLRNPLEAADSLMSRNGMPPSSGALLWLRYVLEAEAATRGRPRAFVSYRRLLEDWETCLESVTAHTGLHWPQRNAAIAEEINRFLAPAERHHHRSRHDVSVDPELKTWIGSAYSALLMLERDPHDQTACAELDRIRAEFDRAAPMLHRVYRDARAVLADRLGTVEKRQKKTEANASELKQSLQSRESELKTTGADLARANADLRRLTPQLTTLQKSLDERRAERDAAQAERNALERKVSSLTIGAHARQRLLENARLKADRLEAALAAWEATRRDLSAKLDKHVAEARKLRDTLLQRDAALATGKEQAYQQHRRIRDLEAQLAGIYASTSWKLTAPVRSVGVFVRRQIESIITTVSSRRTPPAKGIDDISPPNAEPSAKPPMQTSEPVSSQQIAPAISKLSRPKVSDTCGHTIGKPATKAIRAPAQYSSWQPVVSIIVLNRNGDDLLDKMLRTFASTNTYAKFEFIIVDHGSSDNSISIIQAWQKFLPIRLLAFKNNYSFSESNNRAVAIASGDVILLLNNDVLFTQDILQPMIGALSDQNVAGVGVKQYSGWPNAIHNHDAYHIGIRFRWQHDGNYLQPINQHVGDADSVLAFNTSSFPAVTGSIFLCRKSDYLSVGGLDEGYFYGYEDVDLCCAFRYGLGREILSLNSYHAFHNQSTTRMKDDSSSIRENRLRNRNRLLSRFGYQLRREFIQERMVDDGSFTGRRTRAGIAVTTTDLSHGAGDVYSAVGLGRALNNVLGWDIVYLPKGAWENVEGLDIFISMRDDVDITQFKSAEPHLIKIAWMRNWLDRWSSHPWLAQYDLLFCSSQIGADYMREATALDCISFPLAVDTGLFGLGPIEERFKSDCCFTGNYWSAPIPREIEALNPSDIPHTFAIYGRHWETHAKLSTYTRGFLSHSELVAVYNSCPVTIDDTVTHVTKKWGSLNSRVFEALAAGSLPITNNVVGAREIFDEDYPVWNSIEELRHLIDRYVGDEAARQETMQRYRQMVLKNHSYEVRATTLGALVNAAASKLRIGIKVPAPNISVAGSWGDFHFAKSLQRELVKLGYRVRIDVIPDFYSAQSMADDVVIVLRGLEVVKLVPHQINICWHISHPALVSDEELELYDHVFVASNSHAKVIAYRLKVDVSPLLQCSDPFIFFPEEDASTPKHEILFVGNSRGIYRNAVRDITSQNMHVDIYGKDWERFVSSALIRADHVRHSDLHKYYYAANIVLNDHWPDMAEHGFLSNRLFDVALSSGFVISEQFVGSELFEGLLATYSDASELANLCRYWQENPKKRAAVSQELREMVLASHTFAHRARSIHEVIQVCHTKKMASPAYTEREVA